MKITPVCVFLALFGCAFAAELTEVKQRWRQKSIEKVEKVAAKQRALYEEIVSVVIPDDEPDILPGREVVLPCNFTICPETGKPVVVTWKVGKNPATAVRIVECGEWDTNTNECTMNLFEDETVSKRVSMNTGTPDLIIRLPRNEDNHNFWCQVQTRDDNEYGTDIASVVLRVQGSPDERPKFNRVSVAKVPQNAKTGDAVTLTCSCTGYHCDDVAWYKGPLNQWGNDFEPIYSKKAIYKSEPIITFGDNWKGRISVDKYSLTILKVQASDSGRYWCEASGAEYLSLGETGTDAKSVVLMVDRAEEYSCA